LDDGDRFSARFGELDPQRAAAGSVLGGFHCVAGQLIKRLNVCRNTGRTLTSSKAFSSGSNFFSVSESYLNYRERMP